MKVNSFMVAMLNQSSLRAKSELTRARDYLGKLISHVNAPIIVWDPKCRITLFNHPFEHLTGYSADEVISRELTMLFPETCREESMAKIERTLSGECLESVEIPILHKERDVRIVLWNSANIHAEDGKTLVATIAHGQDITERLQIEEEFIAKLIKASKEWKATFDSAKDMILMLDRDSKVIKTNRATTVFLDRPFEEILGKSFSELFKGTGMPVNIFSLTAEVKASREHQEQDVYLHERNIWFLIAADPIFDDTDKLIGTVHILRDITDLKIAEKEKEEIQSHLLQIDKMDSIGRLAGGVAHDLNNMFTTIIGFSALTLKRLPEDHAVRGFVKTICETGEKASALTRQLLAFSRKQVLEMKVTNLNSVIVNMEKMLSRLIGEDIAFELKTQMPIRNVLADPSQIDQVLMNLVVNARDAMPDGGRLTIETKERELKEDDVLIHRGLKPGSYVMLSVTDTGEGMSQEVQKKMFEPFFTTKEKGKGTGMGLSTLYGIVKQHNGHILVDSKLGHGTEFDIYLPVTEMAVQEENEEDTLINVEGTETILVVDDEPSIRKLVIHTLQPLGYHVLEAPSAEEALKVSDFFEGPIHLLLTDVIMTGMNGVRFAEILQARRPEARTIFMSGYTDETIVNYGVLVPDVVFIHKPLTYTVLTQRVRQVLDAGRIALAT